MVSAHVNSLDVVKIFKLSRASYQMVIQNLWWAAGYNIFAIPLAAGMLANWGILLSCRRCTADVRQHYRRGSQCAAAAQRNTIGSAIKQHTLLLSSYSSKMDWCRFPTCIWNPNNYN